MQTERQPRVDWRIAKRWIRVGLGQLLYRSGTYKRLWRDRAVIVLFHRVDDRYPGNPITCSREQFSAFCDFAAKYFKVIALSELLDLLEQRADVSRRLVITFDDAYSDNFHFAAIELRKRRLPACFFIPAGFVGSAQPSWWDAQLDIRSEWMNWEEVRALHAQGFELGSHTITHADLGRVAGVEAVREIAGSKAELEAEMGVQIRHFAYPYGDPDKITEENRSLVRMTGYRCCLAAHGGTVRGSDSPFRLRRVPMNSWYISPYQFGFETLRTALAEAAKPAS